MILCAFLISVLINDGNYTFVLLLLVIKVFTKRFAVTDLYILFLLPLLNKQIFVRTTTLFTIEMYLILIFYIIMNMRRLRLTKLELITGYSLLLHCILVSWSPMISLFKLAGFILIYLSTRLMDKKDIRPLIRIVVLVNVFLLALGFGFVTYEVFNGHIRQWSGIFNHPNALGVIYTLSYVHLRVNKGNSFDNILLTMIILSIVVSKTRGAMLAIVLFEIAIALRNKNFYVLCGLPLAGLFALNYLDIAGFILKRATDWSDLRLVFGVQRLNLLFDASKAIGNNPFGIGMGVDLDFNRWLHSENVKYFYGIPVSASTEKGNLVVGMLLEFGLFIPIIMLIGYLRRIKSNKSLAMRLIVIMSNMFEFALFSIGLGSISWIFIRNND